MVLKLSVYSNAVAAESPETGLGLENRKDGPLGRRRFITRLCSEPAAGKRTDRPRGTTEPNGELPVRSLRPTRQTQ